MYVLLWLIYIVVQQKSTQYYQAIFLQLKNKFKKANEKMRENFMSNMQLNKERDLEDFLWMMSYKLYGMYSVGPLLWWIKYEVLESWVLNSQSTRHRWSGVFCKNCPLRWLWKIVISLIRNSVLQKLFTFLFIQKEWLVHSICRCWILCV